MAIDEKRGVDPDYAKADKGYYLEQQRTSNNPRIATNAEIEARREALEEGYQNNRDVAAASPEKFRFDNRPEVLPAERKGWIQRIREALGGGMRDTEQVAAKSRGKYITKEQAEATFEQNRIVQDA